VDANVQCEAVALSKAYNSILPSQEEESFVEEEFLSGPLWRGKWEARRRPL
jgi:hypothetical protein